MENQSREFEGKSLDLAVWKASQELNIEIDKMRYEILRQGKRGQEPARIRVLGTSGSGEERTGEEAASRPVEAAPAAEEAEVQPEEIDTEAEPEPEPVRAGDGLEDEEDEEIPPIAADTVRPDVEEDDPIEEARLARRATPVDAPVAVEAPQEALDEPEEAASPPRQEPRRKPRRREAEEGPRPEELETGLERSREILPPLLRDLGMDLDVEYEVREDHVYIPMEGDDGEFLLGERGEGLNALQFLLNKMVYRGGPARLVLDVNGYRQERQEKLVAEAKEAAREVRESGRPQTLGPMNPFERRLIHLALRDDPDVTTVSRGDSFLKRVEITTPRAASAGRGGGREQPRRRRRRPRGGRR